MVLPDYLAIAFMISFFCGLGVGYLIQYYYLKGIKKQKNTIKDRSRAISDLRMAFSLSKDRVYAKQLKMELMKNSCI